MAGKEDSGMTFSRRSFFSGGAAAFLGADMAQAASNAEQEFLFAPASVEVRRGREDVVLLAVIVRERDNTTNGNHDDMRLE